MANDNTRKSEDPGAFEIERKIDRSAGCRLRDQRPVKVKDKLEEGRLPTPPPDPQCSRIVRDRGATTSRAGGLEEEEEDLVAYLSDLGASPFEGHAFDYDMSNSATSPMSCIAGACTEEAFEHLDRLYALTEQILELRDRSSKFFQRVRELERMKALKNADRRLELALANNEELVSDFSEEDTGFAESLLDAMLSNSRDPLMQRRGERSNVRSPSSRQRSRSLAITEQTLSVSPSVIDRAETDKRTSRTTNRNGGPKVSKWTRVKAAFKWERACANDLVEIIESATMTPTSTTRYLKIPDATTGSWSGSALSPCTSEISSPSTPIGRVSPASSSNEEVFDDSRRNIMNYIDRQSPQTKEDKKKEDSDIFINDSTDFPNEITRNRPLIRITSEVDATVHFEHEDGKDAEVSARKPTPTLTITIPTNEEEMRSISSPESMSPLPSSTQDSGGSSPQRPKTRRNIPSLRENKRQYSIIEETVTPASKIQRQDSKWNKVRRAFLTNATFSVPPSPVRTVAAQSFAHDDTYRARSCSESIEDLGKTVAGTNCRTEGRRDYQALREKFGAEFHRKLVEWERLKSGSPRLAGRNIRDGLSGGLPLNEEQLAPEFKKKLQDWKRAKKSRRSSAMIEQQRVGRRRLTDWQLWRSSSKPESRCYGKNQNLMDYRESYTSNANVGSFSGDGRQHLCEDFVKRMETWRRMSEAAYQKSEKPKLTSTNRIESDIIDETEFLALDKLLLLFGQKTRKEQQENDAKQLNDCFEGDSRFMAGSRSVNCGNEVLIRTSVGSYRFEGISREFTRKLYDWEKYRGISPRSSTFRLLGPSYTPFAQDLDETTFTDPPNTIGKNHAFHWTLKRSKSDGSIFEGNIHDESFTLRRSTSLQSLNPSTDKIEDVNRMSILPTPNNSQGIKDPCEDTTVEDSEPEAMIVDIEDVIEETASPLKRVQPHQTPVYSVAASETTSIAVPLGTVTSSHEPSPVFLVDAEDDEDCERWGSNVWIAPEARSSENSPSPEGLLISEEWCKRTILDEDKSSCKETDEEAVDEGWTEERCGFIADNDILIESDEIPEKYIDEVNRDSMGVELPVTPICKDNISKINTKKQDEDAESAQLTDNVGSSLSTSMEKLMDLPRACNGMTEIIEGVADDANNERKNNVQDYQDDEKSGKAIPDVGSDAYQLTRTLSLSDCQDSKKTSLNLLDSNLDNKDTLECHGSDIEVDTSANYENSSLSDYLQTDQYYEILMFKTGASNDMISNRFLYEPLNCYEDPNLSCKDKDNCTEESHSSLKLPKIEKSDLSDTLTSLLTNSTVPTTSVTVPRDSETRCLERILINEETLNKIVVPTESTEDKLKTVKRNQDSCIDPIRLDEIASSNDHRQNRDASTRTNRNDHVTCVKKDSGSARNVFVKTKRMIFAPFRRSEDRSSSRKESDSSVDSRIFRPKSKSKSRSTSPKSCRQDALLRVSLSLPWPLRSASKDREVAPEIEPRRSSESKMEDVLTIQSKSSSCNESFDDEQKNANKISAQINNEELPYAHLDQEMTRHSNTKFVTEPINIYSSILEELQTTKTTSQCHEQYNIADTCHGDEISCKQMQDKEEIKSEVKCDHRPNKEKQDKIKHSAMQDKAKQDEAKEDERYSKCETVSSDLMHKLKILSDAAAKREGRVTNIESISRSSESRSLRIRRAKESFLSHRGGPFCRSESIQFSNREDNLRDSCEGSSTGQTAISTDLLKSNKIEDSTTPKSQEAEAADTKNQLGTLTTQDQASSSSENKSDKCQEDLTIGLRSDLVKSASVGMINVDPDTFDRLVATDRGCESLPRMIAKRRDSSGPLAKIVSKLKLSRLIRTRNHDGGNMSTISTLCRQSLLIDTRSKERRNNDQEIGNDRDGHVEDEDESKDHIIEASNNKTIHE